MTLQSAPGGGQPSAPAAAARTAESARWARLHALERELHDGPALRIAALSLRLGVLRQKLPEDDSRRGDIELLQTELHTALQELRRIADLLYPPLLHEAGLAPALRELAGRLPGRLRVHATPAAEERLDHAAEAALYFAVTDLLERSAEPAPPLELWLDRQPSGVRLDLRPVDPGATETVLDHVQRLGGAVHTIDVAAERITVTVPCV